MPRPLVLLAAVALAACGGELSAGAGAGAGGASGADARLPAPPPAARTARVERVVDGDTVVLSGIGKARLIGVDTPEVFGGVECYGREASRFAKRVLAGERVQVARQVEGTDRYGRALVDLWLDDGRFFNGMLVARGYAQPMTVPPNVAHEDLFVELARDARRAERGLWSPSACGG